MPENHLDTCTYRILRYTPNLVRDEWLNIGVLLHDAGRKRLRLRLIEEESEFARLRRLHPEADSNLVRALAGDFDAQLGANGADPAAYLAKLDDTLSNVLQLSPQKAVLTEDADAELERLYHDHVEPLRPRLRAAEQAGTRAAIRARASQAFRAAGILGRMEQRLRVEEFTEKGDPFRMDFAYRRNGTRGFLHSLSLSRDPAQAKVLAYTAERIRARLEQAEIYALTEVAPRPDVERHQFVSRLLAGQEIVMVPLAELPSLAGRLRATLG
jgi:hypothetical protein